MANPNFRWLSAMALLAATACAAESRGGDQEGGRSFDGARDPNDPTGSNGMNGSEGPQGGSGGPNDPGGLTGSREEFCAGRGPVITVGDTTVPSADRCSGAIARRVFGFALCSCTDLQTTGTLATSSFDSSMPAAPEREGAAVGVNRVYSAAARSDIGGTLVIAGSTDPTRLVGTIDVRGDARFGQRLESTGFATVARDLYAAGGVQALGSMNVGGDLHVPSGMQTRGVTVAGATRVEPVTIAPPCACGDDQLVDVGSLIGAARMRNDNDAIGLAATELVRSIANRRLELPCGRFYLDAVENVGELTIALSGRTALFIGDDLRSTGRLTVELGPEAELDLFVGGDLATTGPTLLGSTDRPAATRVYVAGGGDVEITGQSAFVGNVYAPRSRIRTVGDTEVHGALFGRRIEATGTLSTLYDRAILRTGEDCPPPATCDRCDGTCGVAACVGGACGACTSDDDCCEPNVCVQGRCESLLF